MKRRGGELPRGGENQGDEGDAKRPSRALEKTGTHHDCGEEFPAPFAIVLEGTLDLDAPFAGRFAWPLAAKTRLRNRPVCECELRAICSGVPVATILPP